MYEYRAKCVNVVDGDTVDLEIDLGFKTKVVERFRLYGIDTPEIRKGVWCNGLTESQIADKLMLANRAKVRLFDLCNTNLIAKTYKSKTNSDKIDTWDRYLVTLFHAEDGEAIGISLNEMLVNEGLAIKKSYE
jgi:micrococcal nuclease